MLLRQLRLFIFGNHRQAAEIRCRFVAALSPSNGVRFTQSPLDQAPRAALICLVVAVLIALSLPAVTRGQGSRSCGNSPVYRVPVYAALEISDWDRATVPPDVANLLQAVVDRADTLLDAKAGVLPRAEPTITSSAIGHDLIVVWHRDGQLTSHVDDESNPRFSERNFAGARLLARALDSAQKAGDVFLNWPGNARGDSIQFRISLRASEAEVSGKIDQPPMVLGIPVMSIDVQSEEPVKILKAPQLTYPSYSEAGHATGLVLMQFVVDTSGRADMSTVHDLWPKDKPRLVDERSEYYREFRRAAEEAIARARYVPAKIGGCPVRQMVEQPFSFELR